MHTASSRFDSSFGSLRSHPEGTFSPCLSVSQPERRFVLSLVAIESYIIRERRKNFRCNQFKSLSFSDMDFTARRRQYIPLVHYSHKATSASIDFYFCDVCLEDRPQEKFPKFKVTRACSHTTSICLDCISETISNSIYNNTAHAIRCPYSECNEVLSTNDVKYFVPLYDFAR